MDSIIKRILEMGRGKGLRGQILRGGLGVGALKLISLPLSLIITILLARGLGPEGFGQYAFIVALLTTLSIPIGPALTQLTTREVAKLHLYGDARKIGELLRWANRIVWIGSLLLLCVIGGWAFWQASWQVDDRWTLLLIGLFVLPLLGLNSVRSGVLVGLRNVVLGQSPDLFFRPLVLLAVVGALQFFGILNTLTAVSAYSIGIGIAFLVGVFFLKRVLPQRRRPREKLLSRYQKRAWLHAWMPFSLLVAASSLNAQIAILMLGWLSTSEQVAAMQIAERGAMLVALSLVVVNIVIGPYIARVYRTGAKDRLQALSRYSARTALIVALPVALPLIVFGGPILRFIFGTEFEGIVTTPMAILAIAQVVNVAFGSVGRLLTMSGYEFHSFLGQAIALIVVVLGCWAFIPEYGANGAAASVGVGILVWNIMLSIKVIRLINIRPGII